MFIMLHLYKEGNSYKYQHIVLYRYHGYIIHIDMYFSFKHVVGDKKQKSISKYLKFIYNEYIHLMEIVNL